LIERKNKYPIIKKSGNNFEVLITSQLNINKKIDIELVLDFNMLQKIIGIEIINLKLEAGKNCLAIIEKCIDCNDNEIKYSYDEECDSFYLKLANDKSMDQEVVNGSLILNDKGEIIGFSTLLKNI
jgi:uncharacterized protein YuzE